jgi:hypothetical protein
MRSSVRRVTLCCLCADPQTHLSTWTGSKDGLHLSQTRATLKALEAGWDDAVFIPELAYRFWKLTLQVRLLGLRLCEATADRLSFTMLDPQPVPRPYRHARAVRLRTKGKSRSNGTPSSRIRC